MNRWKRLFARAPIGLYRVGLGGLLGKRFLVLEHTGRRSGLLRRAVLEIVEIDGHGSPVIVSGYGERSDWYRNVTGNSAVVFTLGRRRTAAGAVLRDHVEARGVFDQYRRRCPRAAAVIGRRLGVSLIDDVETAAAQLPLFRLVRS